VRRPVVAAVVTSGLCAAALSAAVAASAPTSAAEPAPHASERKAAATAPNGRLATAFAATTRSTAWRLAQRLPLRFPTHHPQGFALVDDRIFMSTVEIVEPTVRFPAPVAGLDRSPGKGVGHVLVLDRRGNLIRDIVLGEGDIYHPGGIDFDGTTVWVPVAEYRPGSRSIVYALDPTSLVAREAFRVDDHVGGVVRDPRTGRVHGVSWGSRTEYTWTTQGRELDARANPSHLVDYQDCAYVAVGKQLCSGVTGLPGPGGTTYELGGLALKDLRDGRILHEVPFPYFSAAGHSATRNPVALETSGTVLRLFAAPDDGEEVAGTELLVYEARIPG
jgi:hypothetical protein